MRMRRSPIRAQSSLKSWILTKNRVDIGTNLTFGIERGVLHEVSPPELHELRDVLHPSQRTSRHAFERKARQLRPSSHSESNIPSPLLRRTTSSVVPSYIVLSSAREPRDLQSQALLARNIVTNLLLPTNPSTITTDSYLFLLGGNAPSTCFATGDGCLHHLVASIVLAAMKGEFDRQEAAADVEVLGRGWGWGSAGWELHQVQLDACAHPPVLIALIIPIVFSYALRLHTADPPLAPRPALAADQPHGLRGATCFPRPPLRYRLRTVARLWPPKDGGVADAAAIKGICIGRAESSVSIASYASSCDHPSHKSSEAFNRALFKQPSMWALISIIVVMSLRIPSPWFAVIWLQDEQRGLHLVTSRCFRERYLLVRRLGAAHTYNTRSLASCAISMPLLPDGPAMAYWVLTRGYIVNCMQFHVKRDCNVLDTHPTMTSVVFLRSGGAASPSHWTGGGFSRLGIGDNVGLDSEVALTSSLSLFITLGLRRSSSSSRKEGPVWTGNEHREATCSNAARSAPCPRTPVCPSGALVVQVQAPSDLVRLRVLPLALLYLFGMNTGKSVGAAPLDEADIDGFSAVNMDDGSAVVHINAWGNFALNRLGLTPVVSLICPMCREFPRYSAVTAYGYVSCEPRITNALSRKYKCPV
ncbi:hypothetical protein FIBSPDRAFT_954088 [Athelia psychrophila]|uniref:Uncharacterized protein n=1 Tax=Athelia psychrophila TaxID=1759441 RepID=A0A166JIJ2_9AGAM|nr:hypothetical protein FIBSPDRAFT_954088 [Fibularhizoctonia sp. CBS 109695]